MFQNGHGPAAPGSDAANKGADSSLKVAIVFDNFGPYHVARLAGAARHCDVVAVEVNPGNSEYEWDSPERPDALRYLALPAEAVAAGDAASLNAAFDALLGPLRLDCVAIPGWSSRAAFVLADWCARNAIPAICMSETNGWDFARSPAREFVKRGVVRHFSSALVTSDSQARYMAELGMDPARVFRGYNAVDNAYFAESARAVRSSGAMPLLAGVPAPESWRNRYFLASNRFIEKKNLGTLLEAYAAFRRDRGPDPDDWPLVMLGDGELRGELEARRAALGLDAHVHMPGFRQYGELPAFYATAGAFVHVSTVEQWGLVINEAMASGLPPIVSRRCGCAEVLVADGENGLLVDPKDTAGIVSALTKMTEEAVRSAMAARASDRIAAWGPDRFGSGLREAALCAVRNGPARPGWIDRLSLKLAAAGSGQS